MKTARILGFIALAVSFTAGLFYTEWWLAAISLGASGWIIWNITKIANNLGAIDAYDDVVGRLDKVIDNGR